MSDGKMTEESVLVTVKQGNGAEGFGWYFWETDCPEEGYVWFGPSRPTVDDLRSICPNYVEETK